MAYAIKNLWRFAWRPEEERKEGELQLDRKKMITIDENKLTDNVLGLLLGNLGVDLTPYLRLRTEEEVNKALAEFGDNFSREDLMKTRVLDFDKIRAELKEGKKL